jgi:hypothetical protein
MSFAEDIRRFTNRVETKTQAMFVGTATEALRSIQEGSEITGAPGQPVDTGNLRSSWNLSFESPTVALIATNTKYAPYVEDNVRGVTFKNHGPHSVKLTIAGLPKIVAHVTAEVTRGR